MKKSGNYMSGITAAQDKTRNEVHEGFQSSTWIRSNLSVKVAKVSRCLIHMCEYYFTSVYFYIQL